MNRAVNRVFRLEEFNNLEGAEDTGGVGAGGGSSFVKRAPEEGLIP